MKRFYLRIFLTALAFSLFVVSVYHRLSEKQSDSVIIVSPKYSKEMLGGGGGG